MLVKSGIINNKLYYKEIFIYLVEILLDPSPPIPITSLKAVS